MKAPSVAVQIVNYKTKSFLEPLLDSIAKDIVQCAYTVEINILDNNSGDNLEDIKKKWRDHNVSVYSADENKGFGAGHNILAQKTEARYLLILNPDVLFIEARTIERLVKTLEEYRAAVVGPRLLTPKKEARNAPLGKLSAKQFKQQPWDHSLTYVGPYRTHDHITDAAWVSGATFLITRQSFLESGGFDEKFFLYMEEVDLCRRLRKKQQRTVYNPAIRVLHYNHAVASKTAKHMLRSVPYFVFKMLKD